jgi:hypothetical protein
VWHDLAFCLQSLPVDMSTFLNIMNNTTTGDCRKALFINTFQYDRANYKLVKTMRAGEPTITEGLHNT